eukprot:SAG22_NODE_3598_length_1624_cov_3.426230_2_plen_154_part_00
MAEERRRAILAGGAAQAGLDRAELADALGRAEYRAQHAELAALLRRVELGLPAGATDEQCAAASERRQALRLPADATEQQCVAAEERERVRNDPAGASKQLFDAAVHGKDAEVARLLAAGANQRWVRARAACLLACVCPTTRFVARPPFLWPK